MISKHVKFWLCLIAVLTMISLSVSCSGGDDSGEPDDDGKTEGPTGPPYQVTGNEGTVTGKVAFTGTAPVPEPINMDLEPSCKAKNPNAVVETVLVKDNKLKNVFVYVKDGTTADGKKITSFSFAPPPDAVTLDQSGCHYVPHVLGIQANQKFLVVNSDQASHNVNVQGKNNPQWNTSQTAGAPPIEQKFSRGEVIIPVKCNLHPWMKSYIGVMNHPFFAVSAEDGSFTIKGLPPGKYTLVALHEKYGEKTMEITLAAKGSATADFSFDGGTAFDTMRSNSLEVLPAIEFPMLMRH